jgi:hypothetical protein
MGKFGSYLLFNNSLGYLKRDVQNREIESKKREQMGNLMISERRTSLSAPCIARPSNR